MTVLRIENLHKRYGRTVAVRDVSLSVEPGQLFGLLGPNGSGKTTTLGCALGLLRPDGGRVEVLGVPSARIHETLGRVAVVFDAPTLVPGLTVRQNMAYARRLLGHAGGRSDDELLELVGMSEYASRRVGALSLGQHRRVSIARALVGRPELLVLDEPLSGLDTMGVRSMLRLFVALRDEGLTIVASSHRLHEMERIVTHVAIVVEGRVVRAAPLGDLVGPRHDRLLVDASPAQRAREVLAALPGVTLASDVARDDDADRATPGGANAGGARDPSGDPSPAGRFALRLEGALPGAVNRALLDAGCEVSRLAPRHVGLLDVFEDLVEAHGAKERA
ncbi:MAG: ABC transporter ATP-binding protein [Planctomycetes bacterium]|nr:ABC transporter ATP-binding protein [Planctomycetota bacterium]